MFPQKCGVPPSTHMSEKRFNNILMRGEFKMAKKHVRSLSLPPSLCPSLLHLSHFSLRHTGTPDSYLDYGSTLNLPRV